MNSKEREKSYVDAYTAGYTGARDAMTEYIDAVLRDNGDLLYEPLFEMIYAEYIVRKDDLVSCPASGSYYDRRGGMNIHPFLQEVAVAYERSHRRYKPESLYSSTIDRDVAPLREKYLASVDLAKRFPEGTIVYNAEQWSDEQLCQWTGQYAYFSTKAFDDLRKRLREHFNIDDKKVGEMESITILMEEQGFDGNPKSKYSHLEASVVILSLLHNSVGNHVHSLPLEPLTQFIYQLCGKSKGNIRNSICALRAKQITDNSQLKFERIRKNIEEVSPKLKLPILDEVIANVRKVENKVLKKQ